MKTTTVDADISETLPNKEDRWTTCGLHYTFSVNRQPSLETTDYQFFGPQRIVSPPYIQSVVGRAVRREDVEGTRKFQGDRFGRSGYRSTILTETCGTLRPDPVDRLLNSDPDPLNDRRTESKEERVQNVVTS